MENDPWHAKFLVVDLNLERLREEWEELFVLCWYRRKWWSNARLIFTWVEAKRSQNYQRTKGWNMENLLTGSKSVHGGREKGCPKKSDIS